MRNDIDKVLISRHKIAERVAEMAKEITHNFAGGRDAFGDPVGEITLIPILTGSMIFVGDLIRHLPIRMKIRVLSVSSYPGTSTSSQGVRIDPGQLPCDLAGQQVLVIDDILDTGLTLAKVMEGVAALKPAVLKSCVLLQKKRAVPAACSADYVCFDIPDEFVVGYGLDFNDYYRNLPDVVTLHPRVIELARERSEK